MYGLFPDRKEANKMAKGRKDPKGRVLRKGESYRPQDDRYRYSYTNPFGRRKSIYDKDLAKLREKEDQLKRISLTDWMYM